MIDDLLRFGLGELCVEQGTPAPLGKFFTAGAAAPQAELVVPINFAHGEIALVSASKELAFGIDTG
jgi:hypothetical protein